MFGSWRYPGQVISDRYQFPSLLGSYADMLLLGQAGADRGVFAPDGCIASDTFQPDPQIFHIYKWD